MRFDIDIVEDEGAVRVTVEGELDVATADALDAKLAEAEARVTPMIVVDLAQVEFMDSTALQVLLKAEARSRRDGRRLRLSPPSSQVQRLFEAAGVLDRLPLPAPGDDGR